MSLLMNSINRFSAGNDVEMHKSFGRRYEMLVFKSGGEMTISYEWIPGFKQTQQSPVIKSYLEMRFECVPWKPLQTKGFLRLFGTHKKFSSCELCSPTYQMLRPSAYAMLKSSQFLVPCHFNQSRNNRLYGNIPKHSLRTESPVRNILRF